MTVTPNEHLRRLLTFLPATPEGIATRLRRERITGEPHSCRGCPIAVYLSRKVGQAVIVTDSAIGLAANGWPPNFESFPLPASVRAFIGAFEYEELFPDLVAS